ncbi:MAG TPA: cytochrome c oxidase subunit II [Solirubrobacteraceae bacterium]|nr:cytochrome c oxidase subunit II [Solirubrobacteraceae bacterium]
MREEQSDSRGHLRRMLVIGAITSVCGISLALAIDWFPTQASEEAKPIDTLWDVLLIVSVPIFVLVETIVLYSVWRFRMRPGEELADGPPIHGNTRLEVVWTAIPAILLVALCSYAYVVLRDIESADAGKRDMQVRVVGEQFTWTFYYPGPGGKEVASNQLYLPLGKGVNFSVQSKDVLHDFWVPAFRQKIDAVPGITTGFRITTRRRGVFPVICAELCGLGHSVMRQSAHVVPPAEFDTWLADKRAQGQPGGGGGGGAGAEPAEDGKTLFTSAEPKCSSCHTLSDAGASATIGPDLDEVLKGKDAAYVQKSITDPSAVVTKGFQDGIMPPNYGQTLKPEEIKALTDYLVKVATK